MYLQRRHQAQINHSSDEINIIRDITTLTSNTDTPKSSSLSDLSNTEENKEGALEKQFHLPPQQIEGENVQGDQSIKYRDAPLYLNPYNGETKE